LCLIINVGGIDQRVKHEKKRVRPMVPRNRTPSFPPGPPACALRSRALDALAVAGQMDKAVRGLLAEALRVLGGEGDRPTAQAPE
jgi:hypothetical protein